MAQCVNVDHWWLKDKSKSNYGKKGAMEVLNSTKIYQWERGSNVA